MDSSTFTSQGKIRYWKKFAIVAIVGLLLVIAAFLTKTTALHIAGGIVLVISAWYFIMSVIELFDKAND